MTSATPGYQRFFAELKRRRVFRVMAVYGIVGFILLQIVDLVVPALLLPEWTYRFVALILMLGFPVAIVLAWAFESTPEGIKRTEEAAPGELRAIIEAPASTRWPAGVLALVGMTALLAGVWYMGRQSAPAASAALATDPVVASIAVLPFADMSPDGDQEYFSDGISEELLNLLAKIPELQVAARTSSFSFKGQNLEITEIADRLKVAHVLEGSVRKAGDQVRVTAQLIRAEDGFHLWSDTWDRTLDDIFAIQDEIATDVAAQLQVTLLGTSPTVEETDPEAYALVLQARHLGRQFTAEGFERSESLYHQALAIDPEYVSAWAGLGDTYEHQAGAGLRPLEEGARLAREAANRALAIDPESALAYAVLANVANGLYNDVGSAARNYERALAIDPTNPDILDNAAGLARTLGRLDEAIALLDYILAHDPVNAGTHGRQGINYILAGRLDEGIASWRTSLNLSPGRLGGHYYVGSALLFKGEPEAALAAFAEEEGDPEYRVKGTALALHELGRQAEFEAEFSTLREQWGERWPSEVAHVYAWTGDTDAAFEWLDRAVAQNEDGLNQQFNQPLLSSLHGDPRWAAFREQTGTSEAQLAAIEFDVRIPQ